MQDPEAYIRGNVFQLKGAIELLSKYFHLIQWKKEGEVVMDIGCGPGSATCDILMKMLPGNCGTVYGVDIQERMVEFGRKNYPAINFVKADVCSEEFVARFKNSVDHVFSFYCFQLLDQRQLMKNLFDILKPGGDILTIFPGTHPICAAYEQLLKTKKWKKYTKEIESLISVYQFHKNIEASLKKLLTEAGFKIFICKFEDYTFIYESLQELKNFVLAIHPLQKYSPSVQESFVSDVLKEFEKLDSVRKNGSEIILLIQHISYCVQKPISD